MRKRKKSIKEEGSRNKKKVEKNKVNLANREKDYIAFDYYGISSTSASESK